MNIMQFYKTYQWFRKASLCSEGKMIIVKANIRIEVPQTRIPLQLRIGKFMHSHNLCTDYCWIQIKQLAEYEDFYISENPKHRSRSHTNILTTRNQDIPTAGNLISHYCCHHNIFLF